MPSSSLKKRLFPVFLIISLILLISPLNISAQETKKNNESSKTSQLKNQDNKNSDIKNLYSDYKKLINELMKFQKPVFDSSESLKKSRVDLERIIAEKWKSVSKEMNIDMEKLKSLKNQLMDQSLEKVKKEALMKEYQEAARKFQVARNKTFMDENIMAKQKEFSELLKKATIKIHPESEKLYGKLEKLQDKIKALHQKK